MNSILLSKVLIEVIEQEYYTDLQVLNQFIGGLKSSILERICSAYPNSLSEAITLTRALESAEKEANHSQMINMIMKENKTKTLEKRVIQLGEELSKKIETRKLVTVEIITHYTRNSEQKHVSAIFANKPVYANTMPISHHISKSKNLPATVHDSQPELVFQALKSAHVEPERVGLEESKLCQNQNNDSKNINRTKYFFNKLSQTIPPAVATEDSSLTAIFPFELEENKAMFNRAALDEKRPITVMYIEATINNTPIKLILDSGSAGSIIMLQLVNQLGFKVDHAVMS
ncbi:hypothetical protein G9A89_009461 [Geosiphon pyriformis]|nr:hypothetical protein G9A89_009461 [Geosiphon pyriformis]